MRQSRTLQAALGVYTLLVLVFLYVPIIPPLVLSLHAPERSGTTLESYTQIGQNPVLVSSIQTTLLLGILTAVITSLLALLAARAVRELGAARPILLLILLPLFIPGVSMGVASAFFFPLSTIPAPPSHAPAFGRSRGPCGVSRPSSPMSIAMACRLRC